MRPPLLLLVLGSFPLVPLAAVVVFRRRQVGARAWVAAWVLVQVAGSVLQLWLGVRGRSNLWVSYVIEPLGGVALLAALALWQVRPLARLTFRLSIPAVAVAFVVLTVAFDSTSTFSRAAEPMLYLVCLAASAYTLVQRSRVMTGDVLRQDWLWVGAGMVLYYGTGGSLFPLSRLLLGSDTHLFTVAYELANGVAAVAFLAVARGVACPTAT